jgi:hypothetical protein
MQNFLNCRRGGTHKGIRKEQLPALATGIRNFAAFAYFFTGYGITVPFFRLIL